MARGGPWGPVSLGVRVGELTHGSADRGREVHTPSGTDSIAFLSFDLDRRSGRLMRAGEIVPVRPKTWAVLLYLAERPGVLVTRDELLDAVWPDVAVTPDTLTKSIGELRVALGDDSRRPRCIETVHGRGFRFIANTNAEPPGSVATLEATPSAAGKPLFVGRHAERRQLEALFAKACAGERQMVFVTGSAGVGKSALVDVFLDSLADRHSAEPAWTARTRCVEQYGMREPYMPVLDALERLTRRPDAEQLVELFQRVAPTWLVQMPWLLGRDGEALRQSLQASRPERMLREFAVFAEAATSERTIVLVLEDLHWSDVSTTDLLSILAQRHDPARLLVIGTFRPAEVAVQQHVLATTVRALRLHRQCVEVPLYDLTREEVQEYLELRFRGAEFPRALAPVLHEYTDGTPLFVLGVIEHLLSSGAIADTAATGWVLQTPPNMLHLEVPDDVRHIIGIQFSHLSPADLTLLEAASAAGGEFAVPGVAAALGRDAAAAETQCEVLARAHGFLRCVGSTEWPGGNQVRRYAFTHELYRNAVYADIPEGERQRLHQRLGEALEAAYGEDTTAVAAELAMHFEHGHDYKRAVHYIAAAAARARQRFANREAVGLLESALALAARLPDQAERLRTELDLRIELAPALNDLHGLGSEQVRVNCERAYEICSRVGSSGQRFQVVYALFHFYGIRADALLTAKMMADLDELARSLGTAEHRLLADSAAVRHAFIGGRFMEACRLAEARLQVRKQRAPTRAPFVYGADPSMVALCFYAHALWFLGHIDRAKTTMQATLAAARRHGSPFTLASVLGHACLLEVFSRNAAAAHDLVEQLASLCTDQSFAYWNGMASVLTGWISVQHGQTDTGVEQLTYGRATLQAIGARVFSTHILAFLAEAHLRTGDTGAGIAAVEEGLVLAETTLDRTYWSELWRLKGELLLTASAPPRRKSPTARGSTPDSRWQEAERCLLRALELARQSEAKALELRGATSLARAWHEHGQTSQGRALLADICVWFGANVDSPDLTEARSLLGVLSPAGMQVRVAAKSRPKMGSHR